MGQKNSVHRLSVVVSTPVKGGHVDKIVLSYWRKSCLVRRKRVVATFRFNVSGWHHLCSSTLQNYAAQDAIVQLGKLKEKDPQTPLMVECLARGRSVLKATLSIGDFLAGLRAKGEGNMDTLRFTLALVGKHDLMLCCNGHVCETDNEEYCRHSPEVKNDEDGGAAEGPEASSREMCDAEDAVASLEAFSAEEVSDIACGDSNVDTDTPDYYTPPSVESSEYYTPPSVEGSEYYTPPSVEGSEYYTPPSIESSDYHTPPPVEGHEHHTPPSLDSPEYCTPPSVDIPEELSSEGGGVVNYTWQDVLLDAGAVMSTMLTIVLVAQDLWG